MEPNLTTGDFVLSLKHSGHYKVGQRVIVEHPFYGLIVKRILKRNTLGYYRLCGDSKQSVTAQQMGWISQQHIHGRVLFTIKKPRPSATQEYHKTP